jgi:hypothetical protein
MEFRIQVLMTLPLRTGNQEAACTQCIGLRKNAQFDSLHASLHKTQCDRVNVLTCFTKFRRRSTLCPSNYSVILEQAIGNFTYIVLCVRSVSVSFFYKVSYAESVGKPISSLVEHV